MKNKLEKINKEFLIVEKENEEAFIITKGEEKLILHDKLIIPKVIDKKFNEKYRRLLYIIIDINESDSDNESDIYLVKENIEELRELILKKYAKYIKKDVLNKYLKMLLILEGKIVTKNRGKRVNF